MRAIINHRTHEQIDADIAASYLALMFADNSRDRHRALQRMEKRMQQRDHQLSLDLEQRPGTHPLSRTP